MVDLREEPCEPCRKGTPVLSQEEQNELLAQVPEWQIVERGGKKQLERIFRLKDFAEALAFANRVGLEAEAEGHHPSLLVEYGRVTVNWWTHAIGGLHKNDFIMAERTERVF